MLVIYPEALYAISVACARASVTLSGCDVH